MIQISLSDKDAETLARILIAAARFYPQHAVHTRDQDIGRQMKKMSKKINEQLSMSRCQRDK